MGATLSSALLCAKSPNFCMSGLKLHLFQLTKITKYSASHIILTDQQSIYMYMGILLIPLDTTGEYVICKWYVNMRE